MTFSGAFVPTFSGVFDRGAAARPWWDPGGTFTAVAAYQAKGAASLSASYTNLVTPGTYDAAPGVAPTWNTTNGWIASASSYLTTGITVSTNTSWTFACRFSNASLSSGNVFGIYGDATTKRLQIDLGDNPFPTIGFGNGNLLGATNQFVSAGVVMIAASTAYKNANSVGTIPTGDAHSDQLFLLAQNNLGTPRYYLGTGNIQALAIYSTTLSATQVATLTTQMNAL